MNKLAKQNKNRNIILLFLIQFLSILVYFLLAGKHIFTYQENSFLLIWTNDYISPFFLKPGGITELTGKILLQFYHYPVFGALILSGTLLLPAIILFRTSRNLNVESPAINYYIFIVPTFVLCLLQAFYYHFMEYNIGVIAVIAYFHFTVTMTIKRLNFLPVIFFPLLYYVAGGFAFIFVGSYLFFQITYFRNISGLKNSICLILTAAFTIAVFQRFLFLHPYNILLKYPLPDLNVDIYRYIFIMLSGILILYPLFHFNNFPGNNIIQKRFMPAALIASHFLLTGFAFIKLYNPQVVQTIHLQGHTINNEWNKTILLHETKPSRNLVGQYFYNIALAETGQLCDRLFNGKQDFGPGSLVLSWNNEHLNWGGYFFYSLGLINEAHRWAYEEMIVYGPKPQNIILLAKTNMINENYDRAQKYIHLLKHTLSYRQTGKELEILNYDSQVIKSHPKYKNRISNMPQDEFFIEVSEPQNNIPLILKENPRNKTALEYQMAWYLLTKDVASIISNLSKFKESGYSEIPIHIEEAILAYRNSTNTDPDLYGFQIRQETTENFKNYVSTFKTLRNNNAMLKQKMEEQFGNTFWYYFHFN